MMGSRRSACDACRTRKLRCKRPNQCQAELMTFGSGSVPAFELEHEPCERCLSSSIPCVTTIASPSTGDSSAVWNLYMPSPLEWAQDGSTELATGDMDEVANSSIGEPAMIPNLLGYQDVDMPDLHHLIKETDGAFLESFLAAGDTFPSPSSSSSRSRLSATDAGPDCRHSQLCSHFHSHSHEPQALADQAHDAREDYRSSTEPPQPSPSIAANTCPSPSNPGPLNPYNRLYSLYSSLSYRFFMCSAPSAGDGGDITLSNVLHAMSDFLTILVQLDRSGQKADCNTIFVMLLCYLHIAALARALLHKERKRPRRFDHSMRPQLLIEGVSVPMCEDMRVKVLGIVLKEQFASIEGIIGLTEEYCVSGRNSQHSRLLNGEESVTILKAVMDTNHVNGLGPDVVVTLREYLRWALAF
ncbi:hypothetical protein LZ32DRAFT_651375 [Colletotrichum eremochloae]|nr:hypothetical protein LZ32DRAFT_651375 [Colletotrichum eremochloae]